MWKKPYLSQSHQDLGLWTFSSKLAEWAPPWCYKFSKILNWLKTYLLLFEVIVEHHGLTPFGTQSIEKTFCSSNFFPLMSPTRLKVQNAERFYGAREPVSLNQIPERKLTIKISSNRMCNLWIGMFLKYKMQIGFTKWSRETKFL